MPRPPRILAAGLIYHITARGNAKTPIFLTDTDREIFLAGLAVARHLDGVLCHAYCLMENHYHLLIETTKANLDDAMHRLNGTRPPSFLTSRVLGWFADRDDYRRFVAGGLADITREHRPSLDKLLPTRDPALIAQAHRSHGYQLAEIATHLGIHHTTAWRDLRRYESGCNIGA